MATLLGGAMTAGHVLSAHKGHTATIRGEFEIRCETCSWTLQLPDPSKARKPADVPTPMPPRYVRPTGVVTPPTSVPEWREARERFGRKP